MVDARLMTWLQRRLAPAQPDVLFMPQASPLIEICLEDQEEIEITGAMIQSEQGKLKPGLICSVAAQSLDGNVRLRTSERPAANVAGRLAFEILG
jgi:hypothetical protein